MRILFAGAMFLGVAGCGDIDHSMKTMDDVSDKSTHLAKRTDDLEHNMINKETNVTLSDMLDQLFADGKYTGIEGTESAMLQEAGFAMESMHFQYWKGDYNESIPVLDDFFAQSMEMMFTKASAHIPNSYNADIRIPGRDFKAVASLASQLDRVRPEYVANLKRAGLKDISAYDVIVEALRNAGSFSRKERLPKTASMILRWKQEAIYMLQLRQIYLPVMVLSRLSRLEDQKDISWKFWDSRLWDSLVGGSLKMDFANQDPARKYDPEQLKEYSLWLNQAQSTRKVLRDICVTPQINGTLSSILNKVEIIQPKTSVLLGANAEAQLANSFIATYVGTVSPDSVRGSLAESCSR